MKTWMVTSKQLVSNGMKKAVNSVVSVFQQSLWYQMWKVKKILS